MTHLRLVALLLTLAGLDLAASITLKEAALRKNPALAIVGMLLFMVLGGVVFLAMQAAEMTLVSLGWTVVLLVLVAAVDAIRYRMVPGRLQAIALVVCIASMIVVALAPSRELGPKRERGRHVELPAPRTPPASRQEPTASPQEHHPRRPEPGHARSGESSRESSGQASAAVTLVTSDQIPRARRPVD